MFLGCYCGMYIPLSADKHRFVQKVHPHMQMVTGSTDVIVTQLLHYHMPLLYCMQPFNCLTCLRHTIYSVSDLDVRLLSIYISTEIEAEFVFTSVGV